MVTFRPIPFVLAATNHGTMIVNRNDYHMIDDQRGYGVGYQIFNSSSCEQEEVSFVIALLSLRKKYYGNDVVGLDCGANIGTHTIEWAKHMHSWGKVISFEAQERIYYALAGNIAINNCLNATAHWAAVGSEITNIKVPVPNYLAPASFGSLELKQSNSNEFIGQNIDYSDDAMSVVTQKTIDSFGFSRVDMIKIDVEGMEVDVLNGASETIKRCKPMMLIEIIKTDKAKVESFLSDNGYQIFPIGINLLAIHQSDQGASHISVNANNINLTV